jgi:quercetin dioxygenase-like cupin family protein
MSYEEKNNALIRHREARYYQERLQAAETLRKKSADLTSAVTPEDMPWETCPQGIIKYMVHEKMNTVENTLDIMMQFIPEGSRSGKHRHLGEEYMFIVEGRGYSLHWDVEMVLGETYAWKIPEKPSRWEWEAGDSVYIPPNTIHQHFNSDPDNPLRFISAESRVITYMGLDDLEQIENAPEYEAK